MAIAEPNGLRINGRQITSHALLGWKQGSDCRQAQGRKVGGGLGTARPPQQVASSGGLSSWSPGLSCPCEPAGLVMQGL